MLSQLALPGLCFFIADKWPHSFLDLLLGDRMRGALSTLASQGEHGPQNARQEERGGQDEEALAGTQDWHTVPAPCEMKDANSADVFPPRSYVEANKVALLEEEGGLVVARGWKGEGLVRLQVYNQREE